MSRVKALPAWVWPLLAAAAGLGVLVWHRYANDPEDRQWLDAEQPPVNFNVAIDAAQSQINAATRETSTPVRPRFYPDGHLMQSRDSWVGDC